MIRFIYIYIYMCVRGLSVCARHKSYTLNADEDNDNSTDSVNYNMTR